MKRILLDRNENRYGPAPGCLEVLRSIRAEQLHDYPRAFQSGRCSDLSQRLAELHGVEEKRVVLGYGCEDVLKQAVHHWLRPGERCFVPSASWWYYRSIADEVEGVTVEYPLIERPTVFRFDTDALFEMHRRARARVLLVASPNNPTGNSFPRERLRETLEHFRDAMVVLDEAYCGFTEADAADATALTDEYPNLLVLRTFSKLYALAGARIGYGVAGRGLASFLRFSARHLGYNRISERLALAALDDAPYYAELRRKMAADRRALYDVLRKREGVRVYDSDANFVLVRFPPDVTTPLQRALEARGLVVKFFAEPAFTHCARITLGTTDENAWLCESLDELLPDLLRRCA